jgi:hypothetical protein
MFHHFLNIHAHLHLSSKPFRFHLGFPEYSRSGLEAPPNVERLEVFISRPSWRYLTDRGQRRLEAGTRPLVALPPGSLSLHVAAGSSLWWAIPHFAASIKLGTRPPLSSFGLGLIRPPNPRSACLLSPAWGSLARAGVQFSRAAGGFAARSRRATTALGVSRLTDVREPAFPKRARRAQVVSLRRGL